ncbi:hypothetical protein ABEW00_06225 [Rossellomorea vietnamensis]|uniref:capsular polysaccharide export protein, LipB/KpsS family n=1 Tax=Rossellomorea vietnamensis TaxID=218284 RepID=UPI003D279EE8
MNIFIYGLNFMNIQGKFTGQPIFLKKIIDEFHTQGHDCYYLFRNEVTDLETFDELGINAKRLQLKSYVDFQHNEFQKYSEKELNDIIDFDVKKFKKVKGKDNTKLYKHNALKILENLREYDEKHNIDMLVVWGAGYIPRAMSVYAKKNNKKLIVMENGYFRPYTLMVDSVGVNYENCVPRARSFYENLHIDRSRLEKYLYQPEHAIKDETQSSVYTKELQKNEKKPSPQKTISIKGDYVFVPFQLETDSQTISHSPRIKKMKELVLYSLTAVTNYNKANKKKLKVVFKIHPHYKNDGDSFELNGIRQICQTYKENCILLEEGDTTELVKKAKMVITINSTVGIEALMYHRNVVTLGNAFYNIDGIVENVTPFKLITSFKSLINRKVNRDLIQKFLYFLRFHYFVETYYPDADPESVRKLVKKMIDINPTNDYRLNREFYKNSFGIASENTQKFKKTQEEFFVSHIKFTKIGNVTMKVKTCIEEREYYDQLYFYFENSTTRERINLKPKDINMKERELTFSVLIKQIFFQLSSIDKGHWELYVEDGNNSRKLKRLIWDKEKEYQRNLMINGEVYNVDLGSSTVQLTKNFKKSILNELKEESERNWLDFSSTYLEIEPKPQIHFSPNKLNVLFMPWIERSTNGLINIIDERTEINFIPFKYFKNVDESSYRSKINSYSRENRVRLKNHIKKYISEHYSNVDAIMVTLDWIAPIHIFIEACKEIGIPTFLVPHESVFAKQSMYYVDYVTGVNVPNSDYILAWGDIQKDIFVSRGFDKDKIINVGTPKFDVNKDYQPRISKAEFFKQIGFDLNKRTMLFVMQPLDSQYHEADARYAQNKIIKDLIKINQVYGYQLILRLPPALGEKLIEETLLHELKEIPSIYLEGLDNVPIAPQDSIKHCDIVLSINSTMLFESALLDTPSLAIKYIDFDLFWEKAGLPSVENFNDLEDALTYLINSEKNSLTTKGWKWAADKLSDGEFKLNASEKIERNIKHLLRN